MKFYIVANGEHERLQIERNRTKCGTCETSRPYMGYIWYCSVQGHFGVTRGLAIFLPFFRKDDFPNTNPPIVLILSQSNLFYSFLWQSSQMLLTKFWNFKFKNNWKKKKKIENFPQDAMRMRISKRHFSCSFVTFSTKLFLRILFDSLQKFWNWKFNRFLRDWFF